MQERLNPEIAELLARRVAGEPVEDGSVLETWLAEPRNSARAELLAEVRGIEYTAHSKRDSRDFIYRVIGAIPTQTHKGWSASLRGITPSFRYLRIAVAVMIIAVIGITYIPIKRDTRHPTTQTYTTLPGERANLTLGNTKIFLAPATTLRVTNNTMALTGHAIFTLTHKSDNPLTVIANGVTTRVLGTIFSVRAYSGEGRTRVSVQEGRVSVQPGTVTSRQSVVLGASGQVSVSPGGQTEIIHSSGLDDFAAANGRLILRETNVGDALVELARWYGLEFRTDDSALLTRQLTITLPQTLTDATLHDIADVLGARVTRNGRIVTFTSKQ